MPNVVEIIFNGTDNVSKTLDSISKNVGSFSGELKDFGEPFASATSNIIKLEAAMSTLALGGIALAIKKASDFSSGMNEVNTLLNVSDGVFKTLSNDILEYSKTSTASLDDIQLSLYQLTSLGGSYADSVANLSVIEKLSVATKATLSTTTDTLIGTMNAYGASVNDATKYSDIFFTIVKDGKTTLPELASSIAQVTSIAANAGIPFETVGAAIAALTASGTGTSQAITQIKAAIQAIIKPTEDASKVAKSYGIDLSATALESKGFEGVLKEIYTATGGNIEAIGRMIPSVEALGGVLVLGADKSGVFNKSLGDMKNSTGATEEAFGKMKENLSLIWQTLLNNFDYVFIKFGSSLEDKGRDMVKAFTDLLGGIGTAVDEGTFDSLINFVEDTMDRLTGIIKDVATNLPEALKGVDFSEFLQSIQNLFDAFGVGEFDLTSVEGLTAVIQSVIDGIGGLQDVVSGIIITLKPFVEGLAGLFQVIVNLDPDTQKLIGTILAFGTALTGVGALLSLGGTLIGGLATFTSMVAFTGELAAGIGSIIALLTGPVGLAVAIGAVSLAFIKFAKDQDNSAIEDRIVSIQKQTDEIKKLGDQISGISTTLDVSGVFKLIDEGNISEAQKAIDDLVNKDNDIKLKLKVDEEESDAFLEKWGKLGTDETALQLKLATNAKDFDTVEKILSGEPYEKRVDLSVDTAKIDAAKKKIDADLAETKMKITLQGDIDKDLQRIKSQADVLKSSFEWTAKVNIADIEAQAKVITSAFESVNVGIQSTSDLMANALGILNDPSNFEAKWKAQDILKEEAKLREQSFELQKKLTESQISLNNKKLEAMKNGAADIIIDSSGLEPSLEMIMFQILDKIKVRATEQSADFLLGVS